ncbi:MAG: hypothetical protein M1600_04450 [Firmicutes bacterium]|jgi:hypothetical protein|nr:hypothetical protein [Bacillota bacterium]
MRLGSTWKVALPVAVGLVAAGAMAFAAAAPASSVLLKGPIYGNIPGVTVRGVAAAPAPWVVDGTVTLTRTHLTASGTWLVIPSGYLGTGAAVPKKLVGTTADVPKVVADITFANGKSVITAPVTLSKTGAFSFNVNLNLSTSVADPVVLIGPPGKPKGSIDAWFASTNFLQAYGTATPSMIKSWTTPSTTTTTKSSSGGGGGY